MPKEKLPKKPWLIEFTYNTWCEGDPVEHVEMRLVYAKTVDEACRKIRASTDMPMKEFRSLTIE